MTDIKTHYLQTLLSMIAVSSTLFTGYSKEGFLYDKIVQEDKDDVDQSSWPYWKDWPECHSRGVWGQMETELIPDVVWWGKRLAGCWRGSSKFIWLQRGKDNILGLWGICKVKVRSCKWRTCCTLPNVTKEKRTLHILEYKRSDPEMLCDNWDHRPNRSNVSLTALIIHWLLGTKRQQRIK